MLDSGYYAKDVLPWSKDDSLRRWDDADAAAKPLTIPETPFSSIPMSSHGYANVEGLVYRSADRIRIAPVIEVVRNLFSEDLPS